MNKALFYSCLIIVLVPFSKLNAFENHLDSLMQIVDKAKANEKLELLDKYTINFPTNVELIEKLEEEAISQSNYLYLASAYKSKVYYYTRVGNQDSIKLYLNLTGEALSLFDNRKRNKISSNEKKKYDNIFKMLYTTKTALYLHEGKYDLALLEINDVLSNPKVDKSTDFENQLYTLSGMAYLHTKKYNEALSNFREAYKLVEQISNESNLGKYSYYMALEGMGSAYAGLNRYENAVLITDTLISKIEKERHEYLIENGANPEADFIYAYFKHKATVFAALWNIKTNELQKARIQLDEIQKFIQETLNTSPPHTDFDVYYVVEAEYYLRDQKHDIAQKYLTALINRLSIQEQYPLYYIANELLAKVMEAQGRSKEAYKLIVDLGKINDSINTISFSSQLAEMNILYDVDKSKILAERKESELKSTRIILSVIAFAFLISLLTVFLIYKNRKTLIEKNRQLYNQYKALEDRKRKIKELENIQKSLTDEENAKADLSQDLIERLDKYLDESKAYLDQDVNREKLALEIGTNRQYLIEAIKDKTGKTFNEYIYSYRLKHAYELIVNDKDKSISDILHESGFPTRTTFYKTFKATYGLTPSELRSLLNK